MPYVLFTTKTEEHADKVHNSKFQIPLIPGTKVK
jgi:hypothetical protein